MIQFIREILRNLLYPQTYRTPAELPVEKWRPYRHAMLIDLSTSKVWRSR